MTSESSDLVEISKLQMHDLLGFFDDISVVKEMIFLENSDKVEVDGCVTYFISRSYVETFLRFLNRSLSDFIYFNRGKPRNELRDFINER